MVQKYPSIYPCQLRTNVYWNRRYITTGYQWAMR